MKTMTFRYFLIGPLLSAFMLIFWMPAQGQVQALKTFVLKGEIVDRPDDALVIVKPTEHIGNAQEKIQWIILAIDPTAEEVRQVLEERLNK